MPYSVIRSHEICAGHRVVGHESKCRHLHGHNYVFHFKVQPADSETAEAAKVRDTVRKIAGLEEDLSHKESLDNVGRVIDFSVVKSTLCQWLEDNWDHKFLHWEKDSLIHALTLARAEYEERHVYASDISDLAGSFVSLPFNPTAENLAAHMVNVIGPQLLAEHGVELVSCTIEETSKCHVEYTK